MPSIHNSFDFAPAGSFVVFSAEAFNNLQHFMNGLQIGSLRIQYAAGKGSDIGFNIPSDFQKIDLVLPNPLGDGLDFSKVQTAPLTWCLEGGGTATGNVLFIPSG